MNDRELLMKILGDTSQLSADTAKEIVRRGAPIGDKLIELLRNVRLWHTEGAGPWAVLHTVKLLGAMKYAESAPAMIDAIFLAYSTRHEEVLEDLPIALAQIEGDTIGPLKSLLEDSSLDVTIRSVAASALEGIAVLRPSEQEGILDSFRHAIAAANQPSALRSHVVTLLAHFRKPEDRSLIETALRTMPTALDITRDEIADYFENAEEPWEWGQYRVDLLEYYNDELA